MKGRINLLENAGVGNGEWKSWPGGKSWFMAEATFGGGSVKLQAQLPQGTEVDVTGVTLSAAGYVEVNLPPGAYRGVSATATAVYASLVHVPI